MNTENVSEIQASSELIQNLQKSKLLDDLYANPKTKGKLLEILKEQRPDLSIPEIDAPKAVRESIQPEIDEIRKTNTELKGLVVKERVMRKHNINEDELASLLENEVKKDGVQNLDTAIELRRHRAAAAPRSASTTPLQLPNAKELFSNTNQWAREEALRTIEDLRRGRM
jgi:hypothetical protein